MTIQKQLAQIVALAQAEVECPGACLTPSGLGTVHGIGLCPCGGKQPPFGTGRVPAPRYKGLAEALTEPCPSCIRQAMSGDDSINTHVVGCVSGRVLRTTWQQGELAGVLLHWARAWVKKSTSTDENRFRLAVTLEIEDTFSHDDCNEQATKLVLEAMKKEADHADPSAT